MNNAGMVSPRTGMFFSGTWSNQARSNHQFLFYSFRVEGIMSAIDFYCDVGTTTGKNGEKRVVITFNGKFLKHIEQRADDNTVKSPRD